MKGHTTVTLDIEVVEKAKRLRINMSQTLNEALKEEIKRIETRGYNVYNEK